MNMSTGAPRKAPNKTAQSRMVITPAEELFQNSTRRILLKLLRVGGTMVVLASVFATCSEDDPTGPGGGPLRAGPAPSAIGTLRVNETALNPAISSVDNIFRSTETFAYTGVTTFNGAGKYLTSAVSNEPLTKDQVRTIVQPLFIPTIPRLQP